MNRRLAHYLVVPVLLNLGLFIHVLLFNLYLADLGYREDFMGRLAALMTLSTALGTIPGAILARRWGLRATSFFSALALALALILRATPAPAALTAASVALGVAHGVFLVTNAPAIAALSLGALGFSLNVGFSIAIGTLGGFLGGRLPDWIAPFAPAAGAADLKRFALMSAAIPVTVAAGVVAQIVFPRATPAATTPAAATPPAAATTPAASTPPAAAAPPAARLRASRAFLARYLGVVALWYAFCAGFPPFFNAYLRNRLGAPLPAIGAVYAISHLPQAAAILLMPFVIARLGLVRSIVATQTLAAVGVLAMWQARTIPQAAAVYMTYLSLQVMSEPGLQNLLMRGVPAEERASASAANLLLIFGINALVGLGAGSLIVARGYGMLFVVLSVTGLAAAALFLVQFRRAFPDDSAPLASASQMPPGPRGSSADAASDRAKPG